MKFIIVAMLCTALIGCAGIDYVKTPTDNLIRISLSVNQVRALYLQSLGRDYTNQSYQTDKYFIEITR